MTGAHPLPSRGPPRLAVLDGRSRSAVEQRPRRGLSPPLPPDPEERRDEPGGGKGWEEQGLPGTSPGPRGRQAEGEAAPATVAGPPAVRARRPAAAAGAAGKGKAPSEVKPLSPLPFITRFLCFPLRV